VGVGHIACAATALGVGHDEDPGASVRSSDVSGADVERVRAVAERNEVDFDEGEPARGPARDVLDDAEPRLELGDGAAVLAPQTRAGSVEACSLAGDGEVLAGEPSAEDVHGSEANRGSCSDIDDAPIDVWPVLGQHSTAEGIDLNLPDDLSDACSLEAQFKAADATEEGADAQHHDHRDGDEERPQARDRELRGSPRQAALPSTRAAGHDAPPALAHRAASA
jgi:hypothetical protein